MKVRILFVLVLCALCFVAACDEQDDDDNDDEATTDDDGTPDDDDTPDDDTLDDDTPDDDTIDDDTIDDDSVDDDSVDDDSVDDDTIDDDTPEWSHPIIDVTVAEGTEFRLMHFWLPQYTGDLWPCAWGDDGKLYTANGDGFGFGRVFAEVVFNVIEGTEPPNLIGRSPTRAWGPHIAHKWGPEEWKVSRKPTGLTCVDGDLYLFFQNLKNAFAWNPFGDAPHASISVSHDHGETWEYDASAPMFTDHVFTTGWFLDFGQCNEHAIDDYVYVYGLDYNWRFSPGFEQTKMYLARVPSDQIRDRAAWEFYVGMNGREAQWSYDIHTRVPVLEDDTLYHGDYSGIAQGSVVYLPQHNRYLYSTRAVYEWIFYEAPEPWGPWTKAAVVEWTGGWTPEFHAGYPAIMTSRLIDEDNLGGWIISSLSSSWYEGMYYNMGFRRFWLEVDE